MAQRSNTTSVHGPLTGVSQATLNNGVHCPSCPSPQVLGPRSTVPLVALAQRQMSPFSLCSGTGKDSDALLVGRNLLKTCRPRLRGVLAVLANSTLT